MWKSSSRILTVLLGIIVSIFPLGIASRTNSTWMGYARQVVTTPSEGIDPNTPGPFYLPFVAGGQRSWQCYPYGGTICSDHISSGAMVSVSEGWAVGQSCMNYITDCTGVILHYKNDFWREVSSPSKQILYSIAMVSADEGWAVGDSIILHYINGAWRVESTPSFYLLSATMVTADEGWAVGGSGTILHYTHGTWEVVSNPTYYSLRSVAMVSSDEGWR